VVSLAAIVISATAASARSDARKTVAIVSGQAITEQEPDTW
jgi:hypothetical protein